MAVTKIHGIKTTVDKAIAYICDPAKTDENIYISSFACAPETAALDFKYTLDHTMERVSNQDSFSENKAFHLIQAFEPGEVSYEQAHHIGKELADKLLEGKYSYILTTHIDKSHIHNHIIFVLRIISTITTIMTAKKVTGRSELSAIRFVRNTVYLLSFHPVNVVKNTINGILP